MADNLDGTFYPPDSLEQLINIYATQNTSIQHCIVSFPVSYYTSQDLMKYLPQINQEFRNGDLAWTKVNILLSLAILR